jgi:hypothetical protein
MRFKTTGRLMSAAVREVAMAVGSIEPFRASRPFASDELFAAQGEPVRFVAAQAGIRNTLSPDCHICQHDNLRHQNVERSASPPWFSSKTSKSTSSDSASSRLSVAEK